MAVIIIFFIIIIIIHAADLQAAPHPLLPE